MSRGVDVSLAGPPCGPHTGSVGSEGVSVRAYG